MGETSEGSGVRPGTAKLVQAGRDMTDRQIGGHMVELAKKLEQMVRSGDEVSIADLAALLRQEGEALKETGRE